jgi:membrane fusion protein (multidrug efflux system)
VKYKAIYLCLASAIGVLGGCKPHQEAPAPVPPKVEVIAVKQADVPITREWVGTLDGSDNASIQAQVTGYLLSQNYKDGELVKAGQLLFKLDDRTFKAEADQAAANLDQSKARLKKTELDVARYTPLAKDDAISQQELDNAIQANAAAKANVAAAEAALAQAKINLGYTNITSPIDGIASISNAQVGELIGAGRGDLTVVSKVNPIKVNFNISEQEYLAFRRHYPNAFDEREGSANKIVFELILADGSIYGRKGHFLAVDRQVGERTGSLKMQVSFENPDYLLRPGQFSRVNAVVSESKGALLVPQRAVTEMQGTYLVAVVDEHQKVSIVKVDPGALHGSDWVIRKGLKAGDKVIAEGTQKVRDGISVTAVPYQEKKKTADATAPTPATTPKGS